MNTNFNAVESLAKATVTLIQWLRYFNYEIIVYNNCSKEEIKSDFIFCINQIKHLPTEQIIYSDTPIPTHDQNGHQHTQLYIRKEHTLKISQQMSIMIKIVEERMNWKIHSIDLKVTHDDEGDVSIQLPQSIRQSNGNEVPFSLFVDQFYSLDELLFNIVYLRTNGEVFKLNGSASNRPKKILLKSNALKVINFQW